MSVGNSNTLDSYFPHRKAVEKTFVVDSLQPKAYKFAAGLLKC
jgi:hypothetical protein